MEIDRISSIKVQILLSEKDMQTLNLSYRHITWESQRTRDFIHEILEVAGRETGFRRRGQRMLVEVFEPRRGECGFMFTLLPGSAAQAGRRRFRVVCPSAPQLYRFAECEDLLSAVQAAARMGGRRRSRSRLFRLEGAYYLALYPLQKLDSRLEHIFCEFGEKLVCSTYTVAALEERGRLIAKGDVLSQLMESVASRN